MRSGDFIEFGSIISLKVIYHEPRRPEQVLQSRGFGFVSLQDDAAKALKATGKKIAGGHQIEVSYTHKRAWKSP